MKEDTIVESFLRMRTEPREYCDFPRAYITFRPLDKKVDYCGALIIDKSANGLGLITAVPLPIGSRVELNLGDEFHALGEVTDTQEEHQDWNWRRMIRLGIMFLDKGNWPA